MRKAKEPPGRLCSGLLCPIQTQRALQIRQQGQHLRVQRRDGLVGDREHRLHRQGAGDADALALSAGEFVRVALHRIRRKPDTVQQRDGPLVPIPPGADAMDDKSLLDDVAHLQAWVQSPEDHLHPPAQRAKRRLFQMRDVGTSKRIDPLAGSSNRRMARPTAVFPPPDSPTSPTSSRDREVQPVHRTQHAAAAAHRCPRYGDESRGRWHQH